MAGLNLFKLSPLLVGEKYPRRIKSMKFYIIWPSLLIKPTVIPENVFCTYLYLCFVIFQMHSIFYFILFNFFGGRKGGGGVNQSVQRETPDEKVPGSILAVAARSQLIGSLSV